MNKCPTDKCRPVRFLSRLMGKKRLPLTATNSTLTEHDARTLDELFGSDKKAAKNWTQESKIS